MMRNANTLSVSSSDRRGGWVVSQHAGPRSWGGGWSCHVAWHSVARGTYAKVGTNWTSKCSVHSIVACTKIAACPCPPRTSPRRLLPARTALYAPSTSVSLRLFPCCWWSIFAREVPRTPDAHACTGRRTEFFPYGHGTVDDNARSFNATCVANASTNWREWNVTVSCAIWLCSRVLTRDNNAQAPRLYPCLFGPLLWFVTGRGTRKGGA